MPRCWFVLLTLWLRVDGSLVRLREARYFCKFPPQPDGDVTVLREVKHTEATFDELRAAGAPGTSVGYPDAQEAAGILSAIAPVGLKLFRLHKLVLKQGGG